MVLQAQVGCMLGLVCWGSTCNFLDRVRVKNFLGKGIHAIVSPTKFPNRLLVGNSKVISPLMEDTWGFPMIFPAKVMILGEQRFGTQAVHGGRIGSWL